MEKTQKERLFEDVPIPKAVATLAVPTVLSSLVMVLYNLADTYFVGMLNNPVENAGVALAVLALIIPSLLTWQSRKHNPQAGYRVKGGRPALVVVFLCGIAVIGVQFLIAAGLLPEVG